MNSHRAFLYLGRFGGGALLLQQYALTFQESDSIFVVSNKNEELPYLRNLKNVFVFEIPEGIGLLAHPIKAIRQVSNILKLFEIFNVRICFFLMPHPLDILISMKNSFSGVPNHHVIHDFPPHPGELFPSKTFIKLIALNSTGLIALSDYTKRKLQSLGKPVVLIDFPPYSQSALVKRTQKLDNGLGKILMIGRNSPYKNIDGGLRGIEMSNFSGRITIAGELGNGVNADSHVTIDSRWLSRNELENYIAETDILVLPYTSASQSGIIPIAIHHQKFIVVSDVGGLKEQIALYERGFVAKDAHPTSIASTINHILISKSDEFLTSNPHQSRKWLDDFFTLFP